MKKTIIFFIIFFNLQIYNDLVFSTENNQNEKTKKITFLILIFEKIDNKNFSPGYTTSEIILQNTIQKTEFNFINPLILKSINGRYNKKLLQTNPQQWLKKTQVKNELKKLKIDYLVTGRVASSEKEIDPSLKKFIVYTTNAVLISYYVNNQKLISSEFSYSSKAALNKPAASQESIKSTIKKIIFINEKSNDKQKKYNRFLWKIIDHYTKASN